MLTSATVGMGIMVLHYLDAGTDSAQQGLQSQLRSDSHYDVAGYGRIRMIHDAAFHGQAETDLTLYALSDLEILTGWLRDVAAAETDPARIEGLNDISVALDEEWAARGQDRPYDAVWTQTQVDQFSGHVADYLSDPGQGS